MQFRALVGAELGEKGYDVEGVETLQDVLGVWAGEGKAPGVVVIDASGQELSESWLALLAQVSRRWPVLVCAGALETAQVDLAKYGVRRVMPRPLSVGEVVAGVLKLLGSPSA